MSSRFDTERDGDPHGEIDLLRTRLEAAHTGFVEASRTHGAEIEQLKTILEAAEKDAARYRWLLTNAYVGIAPYPKPHEVWCLKLPAPQGANLDAAIDAAMTKEPT